MFCLSENNLWKIGTVVRNVGATSQAWRPSSFTAPSSTPTRTRRRSAPTVRQCSRVPAPITVTPISRIWKSSPRTGFSATAVISTCRSRTNYDSIRFTPIRQESKNIKTTSSRTFDQSSNYYIAFLPKSPSMTKHAIATRLTSIILQIFHQML
jgi:hypothetical protein